jgi:uncharacterized protein (TIGR02266 family)
MPNEAVSMEQDGTATAMAAGAPVELQMRFDCRTVSEFLDRHAADVSRGGIFLRRRELLAVGRPVNLNLQLASGAPLLAGTGTVLWTRAADPSRADGEAGMGIRLGRMTPESQETLSFMLAEKARRDRSTASDRAAEFDNARTVVAQHEAPAPVAKRQDAAAEFDNVRTVVARPLNGAPIQPRSRPEPHPAPTAVAKEEPTVPVEAWSAWEDPVTQAEPPMAPEVVAPPPVELAPIAGDMLATVAAPKSEPATARHVVAPAASASASAGPSSQVSAARKPRRTVGIGVAIGGLVLAVASVALLSRFKPGPAPSAPALGAAAASALVVSARDVPPSPPSPASATPAPPSAEPHGGSGSVAP